MIEEMVKSWGLAYDAKKMFGGVGYLLNGNMACGTMKDGLIIVRVNDEVKTELLKQEYVGQAMMGEKVMTNWIFVDAEKISQSKLESLLAIGRDTSLALPPK